MRFLLALAAVSLLATGAPAQPTPTPTMIEVEGNTTGDPTAFLPGFGSAPLPGVCGPGPVAEPYDAYALMAGGPFSVEVLEPIDPGEPDGAPPAGSLEGLVDDTILLLYEAPFDPDNSCDRFIALVDESHPFDEPLMSTLDPAKSYVLVVAGFMGSEDDYRIKLTAEEGGDIKVDPTDPISECRPPNLPFWNGNMVISGGAAPTATVVLQVPNGFGSIDVLPGSDNIGLLDVQGVSVNPVGAALASSVHPGSLYNRLEYAGLDDAPTEVAVVFGPNEQAGSRFLFQLTDQDGCGLQVDPQIDFTTPTTVALKGNYPNPFNPTTSISFTLPESDFVRLTVYDVMGRQVKTLVRAEFEAGTHSVTWDATNEAGTHVSSGLYLYHLESGGVSQTRQMVLLK